MSAETPANVSVLGAQEIRETPGVDLDDRLREVPGFTLLRRTSSLVAHPTTQGVSLRGTGSSGASRTLVLWDGVPANDPFGGWVYWTRFAPDEIGRVEISRGASTSVFGDKAVGGAIAVFSTEPEKRHLDAAYEAGNRDSHDVTLGYTDLWRRWAFSGFGRAFTTEGYYIVPASLRGAVDRMAGVRFVTGDAHADYFAGPNSFYWKADLLAEDRKNGTALQTNSTGFGEVALQYRRQMRNDALSVTGFHTREDFHSTFSSISADRNTERLTYTQRVPAESVGGAALWQHNRSAWNVLGGADVYRVEGFSTDSLYPTGKRVGGGTQLQHGLFAQADVAAGPARFFAGARHSFAGQDRTFFSPSAGFVLGRSRWRARGSVYRSFRAPTLNELFREFRVGNTVTQANAALRPETLFGAEAGVDFIGEGRAVRLTAYRNSLQDLITNVTLSSSPLLIVRQRQNASAALSRGVEFSAEQRYRHWRGDLRYLFVDSRFSYGARVPQVPRHQGSAEVIYERGGTLASFGVRAYSLQFEDERNLREMLEPGYAVLQLLVSRRLTRSLTARAAVENLLDRTFIAGYTPTPTTGNPRLWRVGLRWSGHL